MNDFPAAATEKEASKTEPFYANDDENLSKFSETTQSKSSDAPLERRKRQIIANNSDWNWDPKQPIHYLIDVELGMNKCQVCHKVSGVSKSVRCFQKCQMFQKVSGMLKSMNKCHTCQKMSDVFKKYQ